MISLMKKEDFVTVRNRFRAEKFAMTLEERNSTATITVGPDAPEIIIGDILRDDDEPGKGIYWRVSRTETDYKTNTRTISCNHVISMLKEKILFGEQTTATICGRKGATTCTAKEAMRYVMSFQRDFELGNFPTGYEGVSNAYSFNGDDLFSAMETISGTLEDCWWEYDLTKYPFKLHIRDRRQAKTETELRLTRNIQNAKLSVDRSQLCTRLFPIGKNDLQLDEKYVSRNENLYGMVCKTETNAEKETKSALKAWAKNQLKFYAEPAVTVTITATDLSRQTGEPMDHIMLGAVCQMPLPGYGTTIRERINRMSWSDKIRDPNSVQVTLANTRTTATSIVASAIKSSSKSSRVSTTNTVKGVLDIDLKKNEKDKNKYTLWKEDYKGVWTDVGTFSSAVASWSVSVTDGTIKVTAHPQEQSKSVMVRAGEGSWDDETYHGNIEYSENGGTDWYETGETFSVSGHDLYESGWKDAWRKVSFPDPGTGSSQIVIQVPASDPDNQPDYQEKIYTVTVDNDYAYIKSGTITMARTENPAYGNGYSAGYSDGETAGYNNGWTEAATSLVLPKEASTASDFIITRPSITSPGYTVQDSYRVTCDSNGASLLFWDGTQVKWIEVAHKGNYYNKSGTIYYDSYEFYQGNFIYYYHQTISQQSQAITTSHQLVRWHE